MFAQLKRLNELGVLGINGRNLDYIFTQNRRRYYPLVDDKVQTKQRAAEYHVPTPELYGLITTQRQVSQLKTILGDRREFVIKPAHGSGGDGIVVIADRADDDTQPDLYEKSSGSTISLRDLQYHLNNILGGLYSLGGVTDQAIIEYRVQPHPFFDIMTYRGVPDIRLVVYRGVPVMGMLRLPTRESDGKANLHSGGIGAGIQLSTGKTTHAVYRNRPIYKHPDTKAALAGHMIPYWDQILAMASRFYDIVNMGYIGVDIVIDNRLGPMLLEVNARPGLSIQIANQAGLKDRLELVDAHAKNRPLTEADAIDLAKTYF